MVMVEHNTGCGHGGAAESATLAVRMKQSPAIVVAEKRQSARGTHHCVQIFHHLFQLVHVFPIRLRQNRVQQEHVRGVEVIIRGLLDVASIRVYLALHLLAHHACASLFPTGSFWQSSEEQPQRVQRQRFAQQMCVR